MKKQQNIKKKKKEANKAKNLNLLLQNSDVFWGQGKRNGRKGFQQKC